MTKTREELIAFYKARVNRGGEVQYTEELERVLNLPMRDWEKRMEDTKLHLRMTTAYRQPRGQQILKPIQAAAIADLHDHRGLLAPIGVGQGKTLITFLAPLVLAVARPILLVPASLKEKTYREFSKYRVHWIGHPSIFVESYEMLSQVNGLDILNNYRPDMIICDECFVGDTLVHTPQGVVRIDKLRVGDEVLDRDGNTAVVQDCWSSEPEVLIEIQVGGDTLVCTPNHPFLTDTGWVAAEDLDAGKTVVQFVRREPCEETRISILFEGVRVCLEQQEGEREAETRDTALCRVRRETSHVSEEQVLFNKLFREMANAATGDQSESTQFRGAESYLEKPPALPSREPNLRKSSEFTAHAGQQPHARSRGSENSRREKCAGSERGAHPSNTRWERSTFIESACEAGGSAGLACGEIRAHEQRGRSPLHDRHLSRISQDSSGGRRSYTQHLETEADRSRERRVLGVARLARVESVKPRCVEPSGNYSRVYNLQVSASNTYLVGSGGVVVHNCHRLKNLSAAVTRRVHRYMAANPNTIFAGLSGSIMKRSIMDFWHLAYWALRHKMPLPRDQDEVETWASVLDEIQDVGGGFNPRQGGGFNNRKKPGALNLFVEDLEASDIEEPISEMFNFVIDDDKREKVRRSFQKRFRNSPGIVCSGAEKLDCSLTIEMLDWDIGARSKEAIHTLKTTGYTPSGDLVSEASVVWMMTLELSCGFYYRWDPPAPMDWLTARRNWNAAVRSILEKHIPGMDSPLQVERALTLGKYEDKVASEAYQEWVKIQDTFTPNQTAEWLDDSVALRCAEWMKKTKGIVWVQFNAFGEYLSRLSGVGFCSEQGCDPNGKPMEDFAGGPVIASIMANSTGRNLQEWNQSLVVTPPSNGLAWEQLLGRTHRQGQKADNVYYAWVNLCGENEDAFRQALSDARTISTTVGPKEQRILYADHIGFSS